MVLSASTSAMWKEIERSESYLVCCMFEEAVSLSSSVLRRLCETSSIEILEDAQFLDMMESAGMVLVQSLKELGRTSEILNELISLFGSVTAIPAHVLLTGACFKISEDSLSGLRESLEEFLNNWKYVNEQLYILANAEENGDYMDGCDARFMLGVEKYLEVVEVYAVTLLGTVLNEMDLAISWVQKTELPEE